ncbi:MAG: tetratricopeptide repeat protein, partial [Betaproteobacteria bacterium]|nr:tetratricopeptide repeat protein [Betaproteobacteria bacterium]
TMSSGLLSSCLYSPGALKRSALENLFVGRDNLMDDVIERICSSVSGDQKHHILLVGPRGCGKTHFLSLAGHRLDDWLAANRGDERAAVIQLREEEWGIASYLDFVVRLLQELAEQQGEINAQIARVYQLFAINAEEAEKAAVELLHQSVGDRTLILFCENLADLLSGLGREGQQKWRATIQQDGNWAIVATTAALSASLARQDNPFYGFFAIRKLQMLDPETGLKFLIKKAIHAGKEDVAQFLRTPLGRARSRAIHHFAGGNHRTYGILFDFFDRQSLEDLVTPFLQMADDLTPYYQDRMRVLPPAQRKIVEFLIQKADAVTVKDTALSCLMSQQTAAKQISDLVGKGYVVCERVGRNTFCELAEPLMRICAQLKDNCAKHYSLFVEFLRHWFAVSELEKLQMQAASDLNQTHIRQALSRFHDDRREPLRQALAKEVDQHLANEDYEGAAKALETTLQNHDSEQDHETLVYVWVEAAKHDRAVAAGQRAAQKYPQNADIHYWLARAHLLENDFAAAGKAIKKSISIDCEESAYLCLNADILLGLGRFEEAIANAQQLLNKEPEHWHSLQQIITTACSKSLPLWLS